MTHSDAMLPDAPLGLSESIDDGLWFLRKRQKPDGSFAVYYSLDHTFERGCTDDITLFGAAVVAHCLRFIESDDAHAIIRRAISLFLAEMRFGAWRYWLRAHKGFNGLPADVDTTSCVSIVLKENNIDIEDNSSLLLLNRNAYGLFYTWIKPRMRLASNLRYNLIIFERMIRPIRSFMYWKVFNARPNDVDALINANVLFYLGINAETMPIVEMLCKSLENNEEENCDKWYRNTYLFCYLVSRSLSPLFAARAGVREKLIEKTLTGLNDEALPLNIAFGISTLIECCAPLPDMAQAVTRLLSLQDRDGSWEACPMYYDGPAKNGAFGSEELTTGLCLEALARYRAYQSDRRCIELNAFEGC